MRPICLAFVLAAGIGMLAYSGLARHTPTAGPYKVLKTAKVGGEGGFDYIFADVKGRRLYIPRSGPMGQLTVFNLDTLESAGAIANVSAGGATVDPKSHHGFSTTKPITMWDARTSKVIKTIDVDGRPDGILFDAYNERVWVLSHMPPDATVIDAREGTVVGTLDVPISDRLLDAVISLAIAKSVLRTQSYPTIPSPPYAPRLDCFCWNRENRKRSMS